ncbi:MAG: hypothetical protein ACRD0P_34680, partial [Stackebrandtia sp.]
IVRRIGGRTADGGIYDGYEQFRPGDPGYDELLPDAQPYTEQRGYRTEPERAVNPQALARILRDAGLDPGRADGT